MYRLVDVLCKNMGDGGGGGGYPELVSREN